MLKLLGIWKRLFLRRLQSQGNASAIVHGEGVGGHVIRVVLLTEPLREHSCRTRTRPGTGIALAESGNLVVLKFYSRNTRWWHHNELHKILSKPGTFSSSWVRHSPLWKMKMKENSFQITMETTWKHLSLLARDGWQGGEFEKQPTSCSHDLQLVVQIFVSFKPHAKDSLNSECTFLVQYKHLLVQSWTDLKRNKL